MKPITICILFVALLTQVSYAGSDPRTPIKLSASERALILNEMRGFLDTIGQMTNLLSDEKFAEAARLARKMGKAAQQGVPEGLKKKLPKPFMHLGGQTHAAFDQWAVDAESMEDVSLSLKQLSQLMQKCTACHAQYRLVSP